MTATSPRIDLDPDDVGRGLAQLVLAVLEILRELLERQAVRRVRAGDLTDDQIDRLGTGLQNIAEEMHRLRSTLCRPDST